MRFVFASSNPAKAGALASYLPATCPLRVLTPNETRLSDGVDLESAATCSEIARCKAVWWSTQLPGECVIATDGGLVIPALSGQWDSARTARFAPCASNNLERARSLLHLTAHLTGRDRAINWTESLSIAKDGQILHEWTATGPQGCLAESMPEQEIDTGFWVPGIWLCPDFGMRRLATLSDAELGSRDDHWRQLARSISNWSADNELRT